MNVVPEKYTKLKQVIGSDEIIIFDAEFTSWKGCWEHGWDSAKNQFVEIVQLSGIRIQPPQFKETASFSSFVKPRINSRLSTYLKNLTHISQTDVNLAADLTVVLEKFSTWIGTIPCYSHGRNELDIDRNCLLYRKQNPLTGHEFYDIRDVFCAFGISTEKFGNGELTEIFGVQPRLRAHDALNDCRITCDALRLLVSDRYGLHNLVYFR